MLLIYVIVFLSVPFVIKSLKNSIIKYYQTHSLDIAIKDFIEEYNKYQNVIEMDCNAEEILELCKSSNNIIKIGVFESMTFQNSRGLRRCFLRFGEYIIKYSEFLHDSYGYCGNIEDYRYSLAILRSIRRICLQKGESAVVYVN